MTDVDQRWTLYQGPIDPHEDTYIVLPEGVTEPSSLCDYPIVTKSFGIWHVLLHPNNQDFTEGELNQMIDLAQARS